MNLNASFHTFMDPSVGLNNECPVEVHAGDFINTSCLTVNFLLWCLEYVIDFFVHVEYGLYVVFVKNLGDFICSYLNVWENYFICWLFFLFYFLFCISYFMLLSAVWIWHVVYLLFCKPDTEKWIHYMPNTCSTQ